MLLTGASETKLHQAQEIEKATDKLRKQYNKQAMKRMTETANSVKTEMLTIDMNNQFELIANYGLNVVQSAYYLLKHYEIPD